MTTTIFLMDDHYKQRHSLAQGRFTYGIICEFNTHRQFSQTDIFLRDREWGKEEYIYKHTLHF